MILIRCKFPGIAVSAGEVGSQSGGRSLGGAAAWQRLAAGLEGLARLGLAWLGLAEEHGLFIEAGKYCSSLSSSSVITSPLRD